MHYKIIISSQKAHGKGKVIVEDLTMLENMFQVKKSENLFSLQPKNMFCVILQKYILFPELTVA